MTCFAIHIFRQIVRALNDSRKSVAVTGTTGMASLNHAGGTTLHHWLGVGDGRFDSDSLVAAITSEDRYSSTRTRIINSDVLIIDEIGMLSRKTFDQCEYVCRKVRRRELAFGGLQVIVAGDFRQLPPVPNRHYGDSGDYCFQSATFHDVFPHKFHLTKVH